MKELIITGDDFGASPEVNEAIEAAWSAGVLTQASLMVTGAAVDEAVTIARRNPGLLVGLHLVVCESAPAAHGLQLLWQRDLPVLVEAQFARFMELGFGPSYWDGHMHLHLHPRVLKYALQCALEHGFKATRLVREYGCCSALALTMRALSAYAETKVVSHGLLLADRTFGLSRTGSIDTSYFLQVLGALPDGVSEFYWHPGAEPQKPELQTIAKAMGGISLCSILSARGV